MKKNKVFVIVEIAAVSLFVLFFAACVICELVIPQSAFSLWAQTNVWNVSATLDSFKAHLPVMIRSLIYIVFIYALCRVLRMVFASKMEKDSRRKTLFSLLDGFVKYGCAIAIIILILKAFGVDTAALVASVGVLTLIVGLGAQPLIADIIAGIFIIFEDEYHAGEIVTINDFRGTVMEIGIRSTRLIDAAGNIKIINNSSIGDVINLSREVSLAVVDCDFPYDVPLEKVENMLKANFDKIAKNIPAIKEGPYYKGVCMYKDSNVTIKIVAKCNEEDRFQVERDLNREYRRIIKENGIDISYPQVVVNYARDNDYTLSKKEARDADSFANQQKRASHNLEEQQL